MIDPEGLGNALGQNVLTNILPLSSLWCNKENPLPSPSEKEESRREDKKEELIKGSLVEILPGPIEDLQANEAASEGGHSKNQVKNRSVQIIWWLSLSKTMFLTTIQK